MSPYAGPHRPRGGRSTHLPELVLRKLKPLGFANTNVSHSITHSTQSPNPDDRELTQINKWIIGRG